MSDLESFELLNSDNQKDSSESATLRKPQPSAQNLLEQQQLSVIFGDIENIRNLFLLYYSCPNRDKLYRLLQRTDQLMDTLDSIVGKVLLSTEQMQQFQRERKFLERLACELLGLISFLGSHQMEAVNHQEKQ